MAMAYCTTCDTHVDLDEQEGYVLGSDGEFICEKCLDKQKDLFLTDVWEDDGQPDEAQEWYDYDPDC